MNDPQRILYIRTDRMGDVLMNLPAIHRLRQVYPKAWIALMIDHTLADLFNEHPDIDELVLVDPQRIKTSFRYRWDLRRRLRSARFDMAFVSNPDRRLHALVFFAGIRSRVGYDRKAAYFLNKKITVRETTQHEIEKNMELVSPITGKAEYTTPKLVSGDKSRLTVAGKVAGQGGRFVIVHTGTSNPRKRWPAEQVKGLCRLIQESMKEGVVFVGGAEEREAAEKIARELPGASLNLAGELSLKELIALFKHPSAHTLVTVDSGPAHVAWMSGLPAVILYASDVAGSDPARWGPRDQKSRVIHKPIHNISAKEVLEAVQKL